MIRMLVAVVAAVLVASCGGGESPAVAHTPAAMAAPAMPQELAAALERAIPRRSAIAGGGALTAQEALDWAEAQYPETFAASERVTGFLSPYTYRWYPTPNIYLGVAIASDDVAVYIYGAHNNWTMHRVGALADFTCTIKPQSCIVGAGVDALAFNAYEDSGAQQQDVDLSVPVVAGTLSAAVAATPPAPWLSTQVVGTSTLRVTATPGTAGTGSHAANVVVQFVPSVGPTSTKTVPVTFSVGQALAAIPAQLETLNAAATPSTLAGTVTVARNDGAARAWNATSSQPWLVVQTPAGTTPSTLAYGIDLAAAASLQNFKDHTATVTIAAAGVSPALMQVTLRKQLPSLATVMPYGIPAGSTSRVVVRGVGLSQYSGAPSITGVAAGSVQVQSDTQMTVMVTPPAAGQYSLRVANATGIETAPATLKVAAADPYVAGSVPVSGNKFLAIHDPVRQAIYAIGGYDENALYKYQYVNGNWTATAMPIVGPDSIALSPDGSRLFATRQTSTAVKEINPDTMTVTATHTAPIAMDGNYETPLAVTVDGRLWLPGGFYAGAMHYLDLADNTFKSVPVSYPVEPAAYVGVADGSHALMSPDFCCTPRKNWHLYRAADGTVASPMGDLELWYRLRVNVDGTRVLQQHSGELYDGNFELLGQLPDPPAGEFYARIAITPDGTRIVALVGSGAPYPRIDVFSTTSLVSGTTRFPKIGTLPLSEQASTCAYNDSNCYSLGYLLPSADNNALFWIGNQKLLVFKLPPAAPVAARRR